MNLISHHVNTKSEGLIILQISAIMPDGQRTSNYLYIKYVNNRYTEQIMTVTRTGDNRIGMSSRPVHL